MKRVLSFLLIVGLFLGMGACNEKQAGEITGDKTNEIETDSNDKSNESQENPYEIELSIDNFAEFFTHRKGYKYNTANGQPYYDAHIIEGVLDFAYYKDVVIIFEVTYQVSSTGNEEKATYVVHTNAAGDTYFFEGDAARSLGIYSHYQFEVKSVSGTVLLIK